jgi:hypothetical protein
MEVDRSVAQPMTRLAFYRRFAPAVHKLNDEHVMVHLPELEVADHLDAGGGLFPFEVQFIEDRLFITKNIFELSRIPPGSEILSINGLPSKGLRDTLIWYYSGTSETQKQFYLQGGFSEALFAVYGFGESFDLVTRDPSSHSTSEYVVPGQPPAASELPDFECQVIGPHTILFTYNVFEDDGGDFDNFLEEMFRSAQEERIQHLIIDLRQNQGGAAAFGDEILTYLTGESFLQFNRSEITISPEVKREFLSYVPAFLRWFPVQYIHPILRPLWTGTEGETASFTFDPVAPEENALRFRGDVYLLVGPGTMSSASLFAATLQTLGRAVLFGEETGGYATHYGNVVDVHLPNTGLKVWMPTSVNYGNSSGPIVPEHVVHRTAQDLIEGQDGLLEYVLDFIQGGS